MRLQTPTERVVRLVAEANDGITPAELLDEVERALVALRNKHVTWSGHLGMAANLPGLAADLVLILTSPAIRRRVLDAEP